jgi:heat-inducible transcriptional repressor
MVQKKVPEQLGERARQVLKTLIREHVRVGRPVGSRRLAKLYHEGLSPATLRNVMADLEDAGYLQQPHTSAGRIPTRRGYRFYVQSLLKARKLPETQIEEINKALEEEADPSLLMNRISQLLSALSDNIGIVLSPPVSRIVLKHIEFVRISDHRILVILVDRAGMVQQRTIELTEKLSQAELNQAGKYLVANFAGMTLIEVRAELMRLMSEEKALYDELLKNAILLGSASLSLAEERKETEPLIFLGGTSRVLRRFDISELGRIVSLFQTLEEKNRLIRIITECLKEDSLSPTVTIGLEDHVPDLRHWALVTSTYSYDENSIGSLGVLGPSRMEYDRTISLVDFVAKRFGEILRSN